MGLFDRLKRRLPIIGSRPPEATSRPYVPPPSPEEEPIPRSPRGDMPVRDFIEKTVKENRVVLFMKGSPQAPQCGFSASAAGILGSYGKPFAHVDVLADMDVREGVKDYSAWPTLPQIFINGEFVGGSDILKELHGNGELKKMLEDPA
ncbi:MAG TPA: Grx4 family monothiol glutaredoxin [Myxococcota bacterium]|nr:Grx4 family monothiol glutaredoxin [Myxococcota bacterium]HNH46173.1 Grx4 family monothiol glutaredoxin [Myxococcota bacterium]